MYTTHTTPHREAVKKDWIEFYQGVKENIPMDMPHPTGKSINLPTYVELAMPHVKRLGSLKLVSF